MEDYRKTAKIYAIASAVFLVLVEPANSARKECDVDEFLRPMTERFTGKNPDEECKANRGADCQNIPREKLKEGEFSPACEMVYRRINSTIDWYRSKVTDFCARSNAALKQCDALTGRGDKQSKCLEEHAELTVRERTELANQLMEAQGRLLVYEGTAKSAREKYREWWSKAHTPPKIVPSAPAALVSLTASVKAAKQHLFSVLKNGGLNCTGKPDPEKAMLALTPKDPNVPETSPLIAEQVRAITFSEAFRRVAYISAKKHQENAVAFKEQAKKFSALAKRTPSMVPEPLKQPNEKQNSSDITGGESKQPPQQQEAKQESGASGGGSGSGSSGGGGADQGSSGATAATPPSFNESTTPQATEPPKNAAAKLGSGDPLEASRTGEKSELLPVPGTDNDTKNLPGTGDLLASSRSPSGPGFERGTSSRAASSSAAGGGAGGLGGSTSAKPCLGTDCQQALGNIKTSQFASVGSLGGGGGLGLDGDTGSFDSLFKADDLSKTDPLADGALDGLGALDSSLDGETAGELGDGTEQGSGSAEIGKSESRDLFLRVRSYHVRALKRGLLVGVPKKL